MANLDAARDQPALNINHPNLSLDVTLSSPQTTHRARITLFKRTWFVTSIPSSSGVPLMNIPVFSNFWHTFSYSGKDLCRQSMPVVPHCLSQRPLSFNSRSGSAQTTALPYVDPLSFSREAIAEISIYRACGRFCFLCSFLRGLVG